jgi:RNA polymerase sigma factor (sigma-70 family)
MAWRATDGVKIFLVSLNQMVITGVQSVLADFAPITHGGGEAFKAIQQVAPHIVILDISGSAKTVDLLPTLKESAPSAKTILLAGLDDIGGIREAYRLGVDAIVLTTQPPDVLLMMCQNLAPVRRRQNTMPTQRNHQDNPTWLDTLTKQEQKIVELVRQGLSNKEIADRVGISPNTVRHHLTSIFDKLGVVGRQGLIIKTFERSTSPIE